MLTYAVLVLAVVTPSTIKIDYEYYDDALCCTATSDFINDYNKDGTEDFKVTSICIQLNPDDVVKEV